MENVVKELWLIENPGQRIATDTQDAHDDEDG